MATTTKKKKKLSKAARRRRARARRIRKIITISIIAVLVVIAAIVIIFVIKPFGAKEDPTVSTAMVEDFVDIEPVETEFTEVEVTEVPTQEPTEAPTATPEPTATPYAPTPEPTRAPAYITITATGDVMLGSGGQKNIRNFPKYYEQYGPEYFFENVRDYFAEDDLTIVNLEGPLTNATSKRGGRTFNFKGDPEYVKILTSGSVEICNIANNHLMDYKEAGASETVKVVRDAGLGVSGGMDNNEIEYYTTVNGYTVGSLGFTEWNFTEDYIVDTVKKANEKCDLLIISMHWNVEGRKPLEKYCKRISQKMIDAGADIVIGNHTHSLGEIAKYKGKYVINSLGNFCFGGNDILWNYETDVFRQRFLLTDDGTVTDAGIDLKPALNYTTGQRRKNNFKPGWPDDALGLEILKTVRGYSKSLDMSTVQWLPESYVVQHDLVGQFGGSVAADVSAQEAVALRTVNEQPTTES